MRIMLACALGMSTSILVKKMEDSAKEQQKDYKVWAVDQSLIEDNIGEFDVLLLGPQIAFTKKKVERIVKGVAPVAVISAQDYGRGNGAAVIEFAESLINK